MKIKNKVLHESKDLHVVKESAEAKEKIGPKFKNGLDATNDRDFLTINDDKIIELEDKTTPKNVKLLTQNEERSNDLKEVLSLIFENQDVLEQRMEKELDEMKRNLTGLNNSVQCLERNLTRLFMEK